MNHLQRAFFHRTPFAKRTAADEVAHFIAHPERCRKQTPVFTLQMGDSFILSTHDNASSVFSDYFRALLQFAAIAAVFTCFVLACIPGQSSAQANGNDTLATQEYRKQLAALNSEFEKDGFDLEGLMDDNRFKIYTGIGDRFKNSAERKTPSLKEYKKILNFDEKVDQGLLFNKQYQEQLKKAEKEYDIPKYVITAIIGVESKFGEITGSYNPFNVYVSMAAVDYRADFAKAQLKELLEFTDRKELDVFTLKSSYAGAMSSAQFIPYSVNKWWVGDDIFDMENNIMSVANYLAYFKERTGSLSTAVLRYNPSELYRDTILDLANAFEKAEKEAK